MLPSFLTHFYNYWRNYSPNLWVAKDPSSLAFTRIMFGFLMMIDIPYERGFSELDHRFGDPRKCHFPLFNFLKPLSFPWMCLLYFGMWIGAAGITVGFRFRLSCLAFIIPYWYILILDKTSWNNHSYLFGLLSVLLFFSSANHYCSVDGLLNPSVRNKVVPNWNYLLLKFQIFLLYFYAGVKKLDQEWLDGHSMKYLANHWVFDPFKIFLSESNIEYYIVHLGGFLLDLTIGFWLIWSKSRPYAMFFGASFHLMNSQLFSIGMFPYMCLATLPIFCRPDWPKHLMDQSPALLKKVLPTTEKSPCDPKRKKESSRSVKTTLMTLYILSQLVLPWTHSITQGYNNWTNGLYGYSWDMMVHAWQTMHVVVSVKHKDTGHISYLDTDAFVENDKWVGHADMVYQYAHCIKDRLRDINMTDIGIYVDVWRSLNGRFQQRLIDPRVDILTAEWSPFQRTKWIMPLLTELTTWRTQLDSLQQNILDDNRQASVAFVADFPGLGMDNYIPASVTNATLQVLEGQVELLFENGAATILDANDTAVLAPNVMYTVLTTSQNPACYMYTYTGLLTANSTTSTRSKDGRASLWNDLFMPFEKSLTLVAQSLLNLVFGIPLVRHK